MHEWDVLASASAGALFARNARKSSRNSSMGSALSFGILELGGAATWQVVTKVVMRSVTKAASTYTLRCFGKLADGFGGVLKIVGFTGSP